MMTALHAYRATFTGRPLGAIGAVEQLTAECRGANTDEAREDLGTRFQDILLPRFELIAEHNDIAGGD